MTGERNLNNNYSAWQTYVLIACVAAATLGLELVQTRILSFLYQNNVVYLTVTIVLLGFGISGVFVSLFAARCQNPRRAITWLATGFLFSSFACLAVVSRIPEYFPNANVLYKLLGSYFILVIPFLCSGAVLGWVFMLHARNINRLYFVDLMFSSGAVIAYVFLLQPLGADWFIWLCSCTILVGLLIYGYKTLGTNWLYCIATAFAASMLLIAAHHLLGKYPERYKTLGRGLSMHAFIQATQWTPLNRIDIWDVPTRGQFFDQKVLSQDADAITYLRGPRIVAMAINSLKDGTFLQTTDLTSIIYHLVKKPQNSLVIGVGGGEDLMIAKVHGAHFVTGVEINPATASLVSGRYRKFVLWPDWDGVKLVNAEGRNYIHTRPASFDTVVIRGVDTYSALNSGAYVLSESYLYTVEAMQDYLHALKPDGLLAISRLLFALPRETLRLANIYIEASNQLQIPHPEKSIMILAENATDPGIYWGVSIFKKGPFTMGEVNKTLTMIATNPDIHVVYLPKVFPADIQAKLEKDFAVKNPLKLASAMFNQVLNNTDDSRSNFIRDYQYRIDPVVDDMPFFFEYFKEKGWFDSLSSIWLLGTRGPTVLYALLAVCSIICITCIFAPLWIFQRRGLSTPGAVPLLLFFAALGFGYMTFEIGAMQVVTVYIGYPAYSLPLVLGGLMMATGLGSLLAGYFNHSSAVKIVTLATIMIAIIMVVWTAFVHIIEPLTMDLPLYARSIIVLLTIFPVGFIMGFPFPTAIRAVEKHYPNFIAWAWGVNGVTSVLATVATIIIAMKVGFTMVIYMAATTYILGSFAYVKYAASIKNNATIPVSLSPAHG